MSSFAEIIPQSAIFSQNVGTEEAPQWVIGMKVWTVSTEYTFLLADQDNYVTLARQLHDAMIKAGRDCKTGNSPIIVVKDLPDGLKNGRAQRG